MQVKCLPNSGCENDLGKISKAIQKASNTIHKAIQWFKVYLACLRLHSMRSADWSWIGWVEWTKALGLSFFLGTLCWNVLDMFLLQRCLREPLVGERCRLQPSTLLDTFSFVVWSLKTLCVGMSVPCALHLEPWKALKSSATLGPSFCKLKPWHSYIIRQLHIFSGTVSKRQCRESPMHNSWKDVLQYIICLPAWKETEQSRQPNMTLRYLWFDTCSMQNESTCP